MRPHSFSEFRRIVVKIGSSLLVETQGEGFRKTWFESLIEDVARYEKAGHQIIIVSSGAIAMGRMELGWTKQQGLRLEESQAAAAVGQIILARLYNEALQKHGLKAGQVLLTASDTEERRRYLNARATISNLLEMNIVPIVNENDTVATDEIRYGDNDRLAARIASMCGANLLVILSDVDGLYTASPRLDPQARHIGAVERVTPQIEAMAGTTDSRYARGGMITKLQAAKIATGAGTTMLIASGHAPFALKRIAEGERCTWFLADSQPKSAWKKWVAGHIKPKGSLYIDDGAIAALKKGKSLLPIGVQRLQGDFRRGDTIVICNLEGTEIARGLISYDHQEAKQIIGKKTTDIAAALGYAGRSAMVHRDDMVLIGE